LAFARYFGKVGKDEVEVFGEEFSTLLLMETIENTLEVFVSMDEGVVMADVGDNDVVGVGNQPRMPCFFIDALFQFKDAFTRLCADNR
jgi:hypothetical protein